MGMTRRDFLRLGAMAGGAVALAPRFVSTARALGATDAFGTARASRLFPGELLVHADLHNHSHLSDGAGDPSSFYERIRAAGLDVAALTDHATIAKGPSVLTPDSDVVCGPEPADGADSDCHSLYGMDEEDWTRVGGFADVADDPGRFVGMRGFEWSSPTVGHSNAWFTRGWVDPLVTGGLDGDSSLAAIADATQDDPFTLVPTIASLAETLIGQFEQTMGRDGVEGYYNWLLRAPDSLGFGGGSDGIFGFNHPGREAGRFADFRFEPALRDRLVSVEMFNKGSDFLFEGTDIGRVSPLVDVLDKGWRPGIIGTSDEHDPDWGAAIGKGKGGLWARELSRRGVREALESRRFFATREKGLRVDAAAQGQRMGTTFGHRSGPIRFELDIAQFDVSRNDDLALRDGDASTPPVGVAGQTLVLQVLQTGRPVPTVVHQQEVVVPRPDEPWITATVPIDVADGTWVVLRLCDPIRPDEIPADADVPADSPYRTAGRGVAYTSPWYLDPDLPAPTVTRAPGNGTTPGSGGGGGTPTIPVRVTRVAGPDRIATGVEVSRAGFATGTPVAYVATGRGFADALAGIAPAFLDQAPVLLTEPDHLPDVVADELRRLAPQRIVLLGGPVAVADQVEDELAAIAPTDRIAGDDRVATAVAVSRSKFPDADAVDEVAVATARAFPDALAGGAAVARVRGPLLLVEPDAVPDVVVEELRRLSPRRVLAFGGPVALADEVVAELDDLARDGATRLAGDTRYATAARIAEARFAGATEVLVATGEDFPDALAGGALATQRAAPILLVARDAIPDETDAELRRLRPERITVVGGPAVVSDVVVERLRRYEAG